MNSLREAAKLVLYSGKKKKIYVFGNSGAVAKLQRRGILNSLTVYAFLIM